jgi:hypothetical protein
MGIIHTMPNEYPFSVNAITAFGSIIVAITENDGTKVEKCSLTIA